MTRDDIIKMAREAGINVEQGFLLRFMGVEDDLERFAALVAAAEREACAKVCDIEASVNVINANEAYQEGRSMGSMVCAAAIRARGNT
jgi:hypothetical protein